MKFSIVIPAYNAEKTLGACLQSVHEQTFSDFEAIVVDDGSIDGTHLVAAQFSHTDPRFHYIWQENQGVSTARNRAITEAKGEFVAIDNVGAGIGETVLVAQGSAARIGCDLENAPVDAAIVGIVDEN